MSDEKHDDVPRLPRGRGLRLSRPQLFRIAGTLVLLTFVIAMQKPCASSVSKFVTGFGPDGSGSATAAMPRPDNLGGPAGSGAGSAPSLDSYEQLRPGMTEDEVRQVIERARAKAQRAGSGEPVGGAAPAP